MLSRIGYHSLVIVWLGILCLVDVIGNNVFTGVMSDVYFYKVFLDGALIWWTVLYLKDDLSGAVVSSTSRRAQSAQAANAPVDHSHDPVVKVDLGASEYIYYAFLVCYGLGNLYFHHDINKEATGLLAFATLVMSMADIVVSAVAGVNFYQVASGKLVRLQQRLN